MKLPVMIGRKMFFLQSKIGDIPEEGNFITASQVHFFFIGNRFLKINPPGCLIFWPNSVRKLPIWNWQLPILEPAMLTIFDVRV